jgi:hypothetical protein
LHCHPGTTLASETDRQCILKQNLLSLRKKPSIDRSKFLPFRAGTQGISMMCQDIILSHG